MLCFIIETMFGKEKKEKKLLKIFSSLLLGGLLALAQLFVLFFFKILCLFHNCMQFHKHALIKVATKSIMASSRI